MVAYSAVTVDDVAGVGTTEKKISSETNPGPNGIQLAPNERVLISCSVGAHANDNITVTVYGRNGTSGGWFFVKSFVIPAGDTDEHEVCDFIGGPEYVDIGYVADASTDTPTVSTVCRRGPVNGA